ncbi:MAG: hypothetical protein J0I54_17695 [Bosea sp.]|uniref:hypothetical protein n=1 Tax=unclassified Bosea (in: a-proteobacteria) TaxID=2653178 RepID=UPI0009626070|nr:MULTISPECIES: hypothetical protein [unclassified Bosea (in: a-proteobacteria)]MBN9458467.1 hypothetical protein [Bosea sp. (in: a-proteobacteria)]OJV06831.1 MAG: hypothetical protein BGO20_00250 [Bosea sp. 67-29]
MARAASETEAANGALAEIGEPPIASLDEPRAAARVCKSRFHDVRDALLREADWNFATAWVIPGMDPAPALGRLKNRYVLPPDCVKVRFVVGLETDEWAVEAASVAPTASPILGGVLVTNATAPNICYTRIVAQPVLWDALFLQVFQKRLGAAIAPRIGRSQAIAGRLNGEAAALLKPAKRRDSQEKARTELPRITSWLAARYGGRRPW